MRKYNYLEEKQIGIVIRDPDKKLYRRMRRIQRHTKRKANIFIRKAQ